MDRRILLLCPFCEGPESSVRSISTPVLDGWCQRPISSMPYQFSSCVVNWIWVSRSFSCVIAYVTMNNMSFYQMGFLLGESCIHRAQSDSTVPPDWAARSFFRLETFERRETIAVKGRVSQRGLQHSGSLHE